VTWNWLHPTGKYTSLPFMVFCFQCDKIATSLWLQNISQRKWLMPPFKTTMPSSYFLLWFYWIDSKYKPTAWGFQLSSGYTSVLSIKAKEKCSVTAIDCQCHQHWSKPKKAVVTQRICHPYVLGPQGNRGGQGWKICRWNVSSAKKEFLVWISPEAYHWDF
jgi:hypothetical protein